MSDNDQSDLFVEDASTEDKFFGVKTTFEKKPKEEEVLSNVRLKAERNNPNSVLKIIDNYAYKKTFLMNIGEE